MLPQVPSRPGQLAERTCARPPLPGQATPSSRSGWAFRRRAHKGGEAGKPAAPPRPGQACPLPLQQLGDNR